MTDYITVIVAGEVNGTTLSTVLTVPVLVGSIIPVEIAKAAAEAAALSSFSYTHNLKQPLIDRRPK